MNHGAFYGILKSIVMIGNSILLTVMRDRVRFINMKEKDHETSNNLWNI